MTLRKCLKLCGAAGAPIFILLLPLKAAPNGRQWCPKGGAAPPECEKNPAEGGCFASLFYASNVTRNHFFLGGGRIPIGICQSTMHLAATLAIKTKSMLVDSRLIFFIEVPSTLFNVARILLIRR